jgi:hypothetical protein
MKKYLKNITQLSNNKKESDSQEKSNLSEGVIDSE